MTYHGYVRNGRIELDAAVPLPEGTQVELTIVPSGQPGGKRQGSTPGELPLDDELERIWRDVPDSEWDKLPADLTDQLDHYLYGTLRT